MGSKIKLSYFNVTGRAEPIRMLLAYGKLDFEDYRFSIEEWKKIKPTTPLGQVPLLEIDEQQFIQTLPICRYLAHRVNLAGKTPEENLAIDIAVEILYDLLKTGYDIAFNSEGEHKKKLRENLNKMLPVSLKKLEEDTKKNNGYIALDRLTWADIFFVVTYEDLENIVEGPNILNNYPNLQKAIKTVLDLENISSYIENRPPYNKYDLKKEL